MSDEFRVKVIAEIDWSQLESSVNKPIKLTNITADTSNLFKNLANTPIKLTNVSVDTSKIASQIQKAVSGTKINLSVGNVTSGGRSSKNGFAAGSSYISDLQKDLNKFQRQYDRLYDKFQDYTSVDETGSLFKDFGTGLEDAKSKISALEKAMRSNPSAQGGLDDYVKKVRASLMESKDLLKSAQTDLKNFFKAQSDFDTGAIDKKIASIKKAFSDMGGKANTELDTAIGQTVNKLDELKSGFTSALDAGDVDEVVASYERLNNSLKTASNTISKVKSDQGGQWLNTDGVTDMIRKVNGLTNVDGKQYSQTMSKLISASANGGMTFNEAAQMRSEIDALSQSSNTVDSTWARIGQSFRRAASNFAAFYGTWQLFNKGTQIARDMFENVKGIDSAMVELKKVTNQTSGDYDNFLGAASTKAKTLGTTMKDYINSTADFARLGNSWNDSQTLAEVASKYLVVGDDLQGIDQATEHIISSMKGFGIEANNALSIVDKLNEVSNREAISSGGLGEALKRSASSLSAAGNDIDESAALITAANSVLQDPDKVGNGFKTIAMRVRGAKTELQAAGEDVEGMAESTASLQAEVKALSGVDIMLDKNTFKSTYDVMDELSQRWSDLTDIQQASLTELLAGKHQGNLMSSLMKNFDIARETLEISRNAAGSADLEHSRAMDSIEAKLNQFKATYESLSQNVMSSDFLKGLVDSGTGALSFLDNIIDKLGMIPSLLTAISGAIGFSKGNDIFKSLFGDNNIFQRAANSGGLMGVFKNGIKNGLTEMILPENGQARIESFFKYLEAHKDVNPLQALKNTDFLKGFSSDAQQYITGCNSAGQALNGLGAHMVAATAKSVALKAAMGIAFAGIGMLVSAGISLAINAITNWIQAAEKAREEAIKLGEESYQSLTETKSNKQDYDETLEAFRNGKATKDELAQSAYTLAASLGVEGEALDNLITKYGSVSDAMQHVIDQNYEVQNAENIRKLENSVKAHSQEIAKNAGIDADYDYLNLGNPFDDEVGEIIHKRLRDAGFDVTDIEGMNQSEIKIPAIKDDNNPEEVIARYKGLNDVLSSMNEGVGVDYSKAELEASNSYKAITDALDKIVNYEGWSDFKKQIKELNDSALDVNFSNMLDGLENIDLKKASFKEILDALTDSATVGDFKDNFIGGADDLAPMLEARLASMEEFSSRYQDYLKTLQATTTDQIFDKFDFDPEKFFGKSDSKAITENVSNAVDQINTLRDALDTLDNGQEIKGTQLDALMEKFPQLSSKIKENGGNMHAALREILSDVTELSGQDLDMYIEMSGSETARTALANIKDEIANLADYASDIEIKLDIEAETEGLKNLYTALDEAQSATGLSSESMANLKKRYGNLGDYDYAALFEHTANGMSVNRRELAKLEEQYESINKNVLDNQLNALTADYERLTNQMSGTTDADELRALNVTRDAIADRIQSVAELASQYEGLTSSYNKWIQAQSGSEAGDMYDAIYGGISSMEDLYNKGLVGTEEFRAGTQLMTDVPLATKSIEELCSYYQEGIATQKRFFTEGQEGCQNFLDTVQQVQGDNGWVTLDDNGEYHIDFGVDGDEEVAAAISQMDGLEMSTEQVQAILKKLSDYGFDVQITTEYSSLSDLKTAAEEALDTIEKLGYAEDLDIAFNFESTDPGNLVAQIDQAKSLLDQFKNDDGSVNLNMEGAEEAQTILAALISQKQSLEAPAVMKIDASSVDSDCQSTIQSIQELQSVANNIEIKASIGDFSAAEQGVSRLKEIIQELQNTSPEVKAKIGIDSEGLSAALQQLESLPESKEISVDVVADDSAVGNLLSKLTGEDVVKNVTVETTTDKVDLNLPNEHEVKVTADISDVKAKINSIKTDPIDLTIHTKIEGDLDGSGAGGSAVLKKLGLEKSIETITLKSKIEKPDTSVLSAIETEPVKLKSEIEPPDMAALSIVTDPIELESKVKAPDMTALNVNPPTITLNSEINPPDASVLSSITAPTLTVNAMLGDTSTVDGYQAPPKEGMVTFQKNSSIPDGYQPANKNATVFYSRSGPDTSGIGNLTRTVTYNVKVNGSIPKAVGTALSIGTAFPTGTFGDSLPSNWKLRKNGVALMGELGPELIVNGNSMRMAGENGAEFTPYRSGDIIFNASQTKELLRTGRIKGRGRLFGDGSNYASGSIGEAFSNGSGKFKKPTTQVATSTTTTSTTTQTNTTPTRQTTKATTTTTTSATTSAAKADTASEELESIDWVEIALDRIERALKSVKRAAESAFTTLGKRGESVAQEMEIIQQNIETLEEATEVYMSKASSIGISEDLALKIESGDMSLDDYDKETKKLIDDYKEWYEKALDCKDAIEDLKEQLSELYAMRFEMSADQYSNNMALYDFLNDTYDTGLDYLKARGMFASSKYYDAQIANKKIQQSSMEHSLYDLIEKMSDGMNSGAIEEGSEEWYNMQQKINDVRLELQKMEVDIEEINNAIRDLEYEKFDYMLDLFQDLNDEADFFVELMSLKPLVDKDTGSLTSAGMATMGMYGQQYNTYMHMADYYAKEMEKAQDALKSDPYDKEILDRMRKMRSEQQKAILNAQKMKKSIADLVEDGYKKEQEALEKLIDQYKDALDAQKDLYDYQRRLNDQTKKISNIEKQLASYAGDDSEETQAKIQKLKVELEEAQEDLKDTEFDRMISEQKKMLDQLKLDFETKLDERMDNIDYLVEQMINDVNLNSDAINATLHEEADKVGYTMSDNMQAIWESSVNPVLSMYNNGFTTQLTTITSVLQSIAGYVQQSANRSDTLADKTVSTTSKTTSPTAPKTTTTTTTTNKTQPTQTTSNEVKIGSKINAAGLPIYASSTGAVGQWGTHQAFAADPVYIVTDIKNGYVLVRHHTQSANAGWFKKSDVTAYKHGGLADFTGPAWLDGTKANPEAVLNARDTKMLFALTDALRAANLETKFHAPEAIANVGGASMGDAVFNVSIDHVESYTDFVRQMQNDPQFEQFIQDMTINRMSGKSKLNKYHSFK